LYRKKIAGAIGFLAFHEAEYPMVSPLLQHFCREGRGDGREKRRRSDS
jgi:hypothetical protein